jgi:sRNA-binding protein
MHPTSLLSIAHVEHAEQERRAAHERLRAQRSAARRAERLAALVAVVRSSTPTGTRAAAPACCPA